MNIQATHKKYRIYWVAQKEDFVYSCCGMILQWGGEKHNTWLLNRIWKLWGESDWWEGKEKMNGVWNSGNLKRIPALRSSIAKDRALQGKGWENLLLESRDWLWKIIITKDVSSCAWLWTWEWTRSLNLQKIRGNKWKLWRRNVLTYWQYSQRWSWFCVNSQNEYRMTINYCLWMKSSTV